MVGNLQSYIVISPLNNLDLKNVTSPLNNLDLKKMLYFNESQSKQTAKNAIIKDFYKLLNNANFGYDCRNNLDNCKFEPIYDETGEISYIKNIIIYLTRMFQNMLTQL